jgi:hypothetical protein
MFVRLIMLVALLLHVSVAAGSWAGGVPDARRHANVAGLLVAVDDQIQANERVEPLRIGLASSPRSMLLPLSGGDRLDSSDSGVAPSARLVIHTSGRPPPRA